jgi:hypothetical protein
VAEGISRDGSTSLIELLKPLAREWCNDADCAERSENEWHATWARMSPEERATWEEKTSDEKQAEHAPYEALLVKSFTHPLHTLVRLIHEHAGVATDILYDTARRINIPQGMECMSINPGLGRGERVPGPELCVEDYLSRKTDVQGSGLALPSDFPGYNSPLSPDRINRPDLQWVLEKFHEWDADGTTGRIFAAFERDCPGVLFALKGAQQDVEGLPAEPVGSGVHLFGRPAGAGHGERQGRVEEANDTGEIEKALRKFGGDLAVEEMAIANDKKQSVEERQRRLADRDSRFYGYTGKRWSELLGCSERAATKTEWWKNRRQKHFGN